MDWAWDRHHKPWSWYVRPLIMLGFCAAAYFRSYAGVFAFALLFPLSAILFPAPQTPDPEIAKYLAVEKRLVENASPAEIAGFIGAVAVFLWILAAAFWRRSLWLGLLIANLGGLAKVLVSLYLWPDAGGASIQPAIFTAVILNSVVVLLWFAFFRRRRAPRTAPD